jgi:SAM-dependent methyltransferase
LLRKRARRLADLSPGDAFGRIYHEGIWGSEGDYNSGSGTHTEGVAAPYVAAVGEFLRGLGKPNVVDLGCGDFSVGARLRKFCDRYIACDVVEQLIERNRQKYFDLGVEFRLVDITHDPLPNGDVVILRQVLQHCSNAQISAVVSKLPGACRYLVLTEHLPRSEFVPNADKPMGSETRLDSGRRPSGVVLTAPPFNLRVVNSADICEVGAHLGIIRTTVYELMLPG